MPQKRNPDAAELLRGAAGGAIGRIVALLATLKVTIYLFIYLYLLFEKTHSFNQFNFSLYHQRTTKIYKMTNVCCLLRLMMQVMLFNLQQVNQLLIQFLIEIFICVFIFIVWIFICPLTKWMNKNMKPKTIQLMNKINKGLIATLEIDAEAMRADLAPEMLATDLADHLVRRGMPFREAHHVIGEVVKLADDKHTTIDQLSLADLRSVNKLFGDDVASVFDFDASVESRDADGGTSRRAVLKQIEQMLQETNAIAELMAEKPTE